MRVANDNSADDARGALAVSVVIPCYNGDRHLPGAIESVLAQRPRPSEIVVVDDGSTDQTAATARRFASEVRYIYQPNAGVSAARNRGVAEVRTPWVGFLDVDDRWIEGALAHQLAVLAANPELDILVSDFRVVSPAGQEAGKPTDRHGLGKQTVTWHRRTDPAVWIAKERLVEAMLKDFLGAPCNSASLVRRSVYQAIGGLDEAYPTSEDLDIALRLAQEGYTFGYCPESAALRVMQPDSLCRNNPDVTEHRLAVLEAFERRYAPTGEIAAILRHQKSSCQLGLAWLARQRHQFDQARRYAGRAFRNGQRLAGARAWLWTFPPLRGIRLCPGAARPVPTAARAME